MILGFGKPVVLAKYRLLKEVVNGSFSKRSRQNTAESERIATADKPDKPVLFN